jgi:hypothetical protein
MPKGTAIEIGFGFLTSLIYSCETTAKQIGLATKKLGIWGCIIYYWKGLETTFPTV